MTMNATPRASMNGPLSTGEAEQVRQIARRLRGELRTALAALPGRVDGPTTLGDLLGLDRATSHRLLQLARGAGSEFQWLRRGPGVQAIRQFAQTCLKQGVERGVAESVESAADRYEEIIAALAGSKSKLAQRLEATALHRPEAADEAAGAGRERQRAQLFEAAAALLGRQTDIRVDMMLFQPSDQKHDWLDYAWVRGVLGHRARPGSPPLAIGYHGVVKRDEDASHQPHESRQCPLDAPIEPGAPRSAILDAYSTQPPPLVTSRGPDQCMTQVIDPRATAEGEPVDVVVAHRYAAVCMHPKLEKRPVLELNALVREPARALLFDVYLHRELARGAIPDLGLYLWSPGLEQSLANHWCDQLPTQAALQVLGPGLRRAGSPLHEKHADLTAHVFERLGWSASQFVGYRCAVRYPMWGGAYAMTFDYSVLPD